MSHNYDILFIVGEFSNSLIFPILWRHTSLCLTMRSHSASETSMWAEPSLTIGDVYPR